MTRRFDGANVAWENRFVGLTDTLLVRATGDSLWQVATAARTAEFGADVVDAARLLFAAGVAVGDGDSDAIDAALDAAGIGPPYADDFLTSLVSLNQLLLSRRHVVAVDSLTSDTPTSTRRARRGCRARARTRFSASSGPDWLRICVPPPLPISTCTRRR